MEFRIRPAVASDAAGLASCLRAAYSPARQRGVELPAIDQGLEEDIRNRLVWVAEVDGRIVGGLIASIEAETAQLVNIAVNPTRGGNGIGRRLIEIAQRKLADAGAKQISLATHVDMPENVALYRHLGWRETDRVGNKVFMIRDID